ncbi:MAG TPA: efflux RND transporter periplasmic adaptor subunit [Verrucomicrobiae bacterium]|nr:efflux RND transporter periplasmic adaptor subunit [Verrucomicrobiae bacterium]
MRRSKTLRWLKRLLLLVILAFGVGYGNWYWQTNQLAVAVPQFDRQPISRGDLTQVITASGQLNPVVKVDISSQISGIIQMLFVDFNSPVKEGQIVATLDPATYEANVLTAEGNLASARANLELAQLIEKRARTLRKDSLNSQAEYDMAVADLHKAESSVKINEGSLKKAQVDLARCTIRSPIDGLVITRNVNVGQTVAASLSAPVLMVIANDLSKMRIEANVVEADIGRVQPGQAVDFRVDAYPSEKFKGQVTQVRNAPKEELNVVAYQTIIEVSNQDLKLKPGMTANVAIIVSNREDTLKIPNAALRFKPPKEIRVATTEAAPASASTNSENRAVSAASGSTKGRDKSKPKSGRTVYLLAVERSSTNGPASDARATNDPAVSSPPTGSEGAPVLRAVEIKYGISDGSSTEVLEGLSEGDQVVTGIAKSKERPKHIFNPFALNR